MSFQIKFWGVRGSIACPSRYHMKYGGNTSCVEIILDDTRRLILDAGTGIRYLGQHFLKNDIHEAHLLLTHTHWDHINGFPFFVPAYDPKRSIHIMAGHLGKRKGGIHGALAAQMDSPMFPVPLSTMKAKLRFDDFEAGDKFLLYSDVSVRTAPLNHPNNATAYRIDCGGKSVCYVTDTEHVPGELDDNILGLIEGADMVIYDSTYTEEEYPKHMGWGHSTWNEGVKLCQAASAGKMAIFHHEPDHDDEFMGKLEKEAKEYWDGSFAAMDGMVVNLD
jgi:phosphoribosyl 1,2-cyclic phosphodiesterase